MILRIGNRDIQAIQVTEEQLKVLHRKFFELFAVEPEIEVYAKDVMSQDGDPVFLRHATRIDWRERHVGKIHHITVTFSIMNIDGKLIWVYTKKGVWETAILRLPGDEEVTIP